MKAKMSNFRFYDYDPNSDGELIVDAYFGLFKFQCEIKGYTNQTQNVKGLKIYKRYEVIYTYGGHKRYKMINYDSNSSYAEKDIKKNIIAIIEYCYNKNKTTGKISIGLDE